MVCHNFCQAHFQEVGLMQTLTYHIIGKTFGWESRALVITWSWPLAHVISHPKIWPIETYNCPIIDHHMHLTLYCPQGPHGLFAKMRSHLSWGNGYLPKKIAWTSGIPTAIQPWCQVEDPRLDEKDACFARPGTLQALCTSSWSLRRLFCLSLPVKIAR